MSISGVSYMKVPGPSTTTVINVGLIEARLAATQCGKALPYRAPGFLSFLRLSLWKGNRVTVAGKA